MAKFNPKWIEDFNDISELSFSGSNDKSVAADVTNFLFSSSIRSFMAQVSVTVDAATDLYEVFEIRGLNRAGTWELSISSSFDDSGVDFSIVAGQMQYTSQNYPSFNSLTIKFRATTTTV